MVATNSFTAKGGDGYDSLKEAYENGKMINIDVPDYEAFRQYIETHSPVSPKVEGRIVVAGADDETPPTEDPGDEPGGPGGEPGDESGEDPGQDDGSKD